MKSTRDGNSIDLGRAQVVVSYASLYPSSLLHRYGATQLFVVASVFVIYPYPQFVPSSSEILSYQIESLIQQIRQNISIGIVRIHDHPKRQIYVCGTMPTLLVDDYELLSLLDPMLRNTEVVTDSGENLYPSLP